MGVFFLNVYSLIMWIQRLGINRQRHKFIMSRLTRISRPEIARFRLDFKHVPRPCGDYVHRELVQRFISEYLEADGFFFICILRVNVSDFSVQEIIERLWHIYAMKYGNQHAKEAEEAFYASRKRPGSFRPGNRGLQPSVSILDPRSTTRGGNKLLRKQHSNIKANTLKSTNTFEGVSSPINQDRQKV